MSAPTTIQPSRPAPATAKKKKSHRTLIISLILLLVVATVGVMIAASKRKDKGVAVTTEKAITKTITQLVNATGKIQPEIEVKIAPEVAGEILEMPFREGDVVKKGDLLVRIKDDTYRYQVEQQEASLVAARASSLVNKSALQKADEDLKRNRDLYDKHLISDSDLAVVTNAYEGAKAEYASAIANISRTEGLLNQMRDLLNKAIIYAPISGTVTSRTSEVGERVVATGSFAGTEVMRLADLSKMEARVNINENDIVNVKIGDKTRISIDAYPNRKFTGEVKEISAAAKTTGLNTQEEVTNFEVKIRIMDKDVTLRPGMSASVDVETKTVQNVVAVPIQAVTVRSREGDKTIDQLAGERDMKAKQVQGEGAATAVNEKLQHEREKEDRASLKRVVFIRNGDTVKMTPVETGIGDTTHIEIKSGVKVGDEVVSGPFSVITRTLKDGMKIRIEPPKKMPAKK
jgi:HlyD family secretion protein